MSLVNFVWASRLERSPAVLARAEALEAALALSFPIASAMAATWLSTALPASAATWARSALSAIAWPRVWSQLSWTSLSGAFRFARVANWSADSRRATACPVPQASGPNHSFWSFQWGGWLWLKLSSSKIIVGWPAATISASMERWHDTHCSARLSTSLVSYMPRLTDFALGHSFSPLSCPSSHFSAGPWQESQLTPSATSYLARGAICSFER